MSVRVETTADADQYGVVALDALREALHLPFVRKSTGRSYRVVGVVLDTAQQAWAFVYVGEANFLAQRVDDDQSLVFTRRIGEFYEKFERR